MKKTYHQQEDETAASYGIFQEYLQLGTDRTIGKLAKIVDKSEKRLYNLSSVQKWAERTVEYARETFDVVMELRRSDIAERQYEILDAGYNDYNTLLEQWRDIYTDPKIPPTSKQLKEAANSRLAIENLGRKAAGLPNTYLQSSVETTSADEPIKLSWDMPKIIPGQTTSQPVEQTQQDRDEVDSDAQLLSD